MTNSDSTTRPKSPTFATVNLKKRNSSPSKNKQTTTQNPPQSAFKTAPQYIQKSDKKKTPIHTTKAVDQRQAQLLNFN